MRILVTGATGYIGRAVTLALINAGHHVTALGRNVQNLEALRKAGAESLQADLWDADAWSRLVRESNGVVHLAAASVCASELDHLIVSQVLKHAEASPDFKCLVYTSGTMPLGNTGHDCAAEDAPFGEGAVPSFVAWRPAHERRVLSLARTGFRAIAVRPGFVYGGGYGVFGLLLDLADCRGFIRLPGTGGQHWPLVHIDDVAHLYALVTDRGETGIYHAVADQSVCARDLGEAIAKAAGFPKPGWRSWLLSEARAEIGSLADGLALDQCVTALRARALGWFPQHQDALAEVQAEVQSWKQRKLA